MPTAGREGDGVRLAPDQVPSGWSAIAPVYERAFESLTRQFAQQAIQWLALQPAERVLDVAAGTGAFSLEAARQGADVLATDFAPGMIGRLRQRLDEAMIHNVQTAVMDGQRLSVETASFDVSASVFGVIFFPDIQQGLRELHRVLKPGGRCLVTCWDDPEHFEMMVYLQRAIALAVPDFDLPRQPPVWARLCGEEALRRALRQAGFPAVEVRTVEGELVPDSVTRFWEDFTSSAPPLASLFERLGEANRARVGEQFIRLVTEDGRVERPRLRARACLAVARKEAG